MTDLLPCWKETLARLGRAGSLVDSIGQMLLDCWNEPQRHYHTSVHLLSLLNLLAGCEDSVLLAAWFHDSIYDPRSSTNEEASAALALEQLTRLGLPSTIVEEVVRLVLLTKGHSTTEADISGQILLDVDLAILGAPWPEYERYAQQIRQEYSWVGEMEYRNGRIAVLQRFLERPSIYHTPTFRTRLEATARTNLTRECAFLLESGNPS